MQYNTQSKKLVMPEYGRNIQQMIDFCVGIENREERMRCAKAIAKIMANFFPELSDMENGDRKIWDHLNIMADFKLDIDFPYEVIGREKMNLKPNVIPYSSSRIKYRHYGKNIESMIDKIANLPEGKDRDVLVSMVAHHMKKLMLLYNKEGVDDAKILHDLDDYSKGAIRLDPEKYILHEFQEASQQAQTKNSKKKKK